MYLISLLYGLSKRRPSNEFQDMNYDLMTFGDMLHDGFTFAGYNCVCTVI